MNLLFEMRRVKDLSPSERQVVTFILDNPEKICNMGIVEVAQITYTSTGTIMRLCKKFGLESFIDFRLQIAANLNEYTSETNLLKKHLPIEPKNSTENIIDIVTKSNLNAILEVKKLNNLPTFHRITEMILSAKQIDFYGCGVSNLICHDAMIKAMRLGIPSTAYSYYTEMAMLAKTSNTNHLAVLISYTGQTKEILKIAEILNLNKIPSISITSHTDNGLINLCNVNLFVNSYENIYRIGGMSSRIGIQHILDIIFSIYINSNFDSVKSIIGKTFISDTLEIKK
ncbi:MAG: MurR/RpiR family transcriptional regulator [Clostridiaceae bacterium]